jgi:CheY-like chemotaxis protein
LHRSEGGLGIGLAIVKGIAELHGGQVEARSAGLGRGSEFILRLPHDMEGDSDMPVETRSVPSPQQASGGLTIVIADDNRDSADSLKMLLELDGHTIHVANDGQEALDLVEQIRPRLALLDIGMPRLNGYEVATKIRQKPWGREVRLVAFTGWGQSQDRERALSAGFDKHLTKPVDFDAVRSIVQQTET